MAVPRAPGLLVALLLSPLVAGCVSAATYEHDVATARAEARAAQQTADARAEPLMTALAALQRALESEAELRAVSVRSLEAQVARLQSTAASDKASAPAAGGKDTAALQAELRRLREQEQANAARMQRIEEALRQLAARKANRTVELDNSDPWMLHSYPYLELRSRRRSGRRTGAAQGPSSHPSGSTMRVALCPSK